jgi:hypothetical protein
MSTGTLLRRPSAFLPIAMSFAAFVLVAWFTATFGVDRQPHDEGAPARMFQLLLVARLPIAIWFARSWLPRARRPAALILAVRCGAALAAIALVVIFER